METHTMQGFCKMASSVTGCLNFTWDSPSNNEGGKMPVLDTQMWMAPCAKIWGVPEPLIDGEVQLPTSESVTVIQYSFYRKTMANRTPIHARSAAPEKDKVTTVTNEFIRRMKNTSRSLPRFHLEEYLQNYFL